jgi:UDP-N-acetylmuramoyl-tripeptide--D-alanyl-D-alanine ligase
MQSWCLADIVQYTHGSLLQGEAQRRVHGVSTDSRLVQAGELFIALRGERFDGHQFVAAAVQRGATAVMLSEAWAASDSPDVDRSSPAVILVPDTLRALQDLARARRQQFHGTVVAITGSNGKTTVKEMTAAVLQQRFSTFKSPGNLNNHIGLPLAWLRVPPADDVVVCEMGMNHLGEIQLLCDIARPHVGVVTNIALAHVGYVGSLERIQQAKGELIDALDASGVAIVNADDPRTYALGQRAACRVITFGTDSKATVRGQVRADYGLQGVQWMLEIDGTTWDVSLPLPGIHNMMNALAAIAVGVALQIPFADMVAGLQAYHGLYGRLSIRRGQDDVTLIDDTYNANPQSMRVALDVLGHISVAGRRLAVLGDMLELGDAAPTLHREIGALVPHCGVDHLIVVGEFARYIAEGAHDAGMAPASIHYAASRDEALALLQHLLRPRDVVLFKGSRGMAMEHLVSALSVDAGEP